MEPAGLSWPQVNGRLTAMSSESGLRIRKIQMENLDPSQHVPERRKSSPPKAILGRSAPRAIGGIVWNRCPHVPSI